MDHGFEFLTSVEEIIHPVLLIIPCFTRRGGGDKGKAQAPLSNCLDYGILPDC